MSLLGNDCYFFCTSTCAKGPACPFRHVEAAKTSKIICQHWQMGGCYRPMCKFRHSDFKLQLDTSDIPCYWETQPTGCIKKNCTYKHSKPRPPADLATAAISGSGDSLAGGVARGGQEMAATSQNMVRPLVKPVIIQTAAESEDSSTSPVKKLQETPSVSVATGHAQKESEASSNDKKPDTVEEKTYNKENKNKDEGKQEEDAKSTDSLPKKTVAKKVKKVKVAAKKVKQTPSANGKKVVKKVPANATKKVKAKAAVKAKKPPQSQPHKPVKERLGMAPSRSSDMPALKRGESESGGDSDDSLENVKVMSMEEIFRQKALESMLKKRAAEGKAPAPAKQQVRKTTSAPAKKIQPIIAAAKSSSSSSSSEEEESSEDEEEEEEEHGASKQSSSSSSSSSSSDSSSSSSSEEDSEDSDQFEPDVRRVVVDVDSEKAARKRAKASLLKKQKQSAISILGRPKGGKVTKATARLVNQSLTNTKLEKADKKSKALKKRLVNVDYDSDDIVSARVKKPLVLNVSVRDRLGKPVGGLNRTASAAGQLYEAEKRGLVSGVPKRTTVVKSDSPSKTILRTSKSSGSEDDHDPLAEVKVKTLEEIRQEKMRKLAAQQKETGSPQGSPVKQRLGMATAEENDDDRKGRKILLVTDTGSKSDEGSSSKPSEEQKKAKRRPWRSQKRNVVGASSGEGGGDDERTAVITSLTARDLKQGTTEDDDYAIELNRYKEEQHVEESPFEQLRRRALMKKIEMQKSKRLLKSASFGDEDSSQDAPASPRRNILQDLKSVEELEAEAKAVEKAEKAEDSSGSKKHRHKHKHKHHKKVKTERQIYMPPAMKNSAVTLKSASPEKTVPARQPVTAPTAKVAPQKRGPHPIAAAWAAGLSLSSKGVPIRRPEMVDKVGVGERLGVAERLGNKEVPSEPRTKITAIKPPDSSSETGGVKIKTFSEIMAEKRQRRLEMQAQKAGTAAISTSVSTLPSFSSLPLSSTPSVFSSVSSASLTSSSGQLVTSPVKAAEPKPRVPVTPIVFGIDSPASLSQKTFGQPNVIPTQPRVENGPPSSAIETTSPIKPQIAPTHPLTTQPVSKAEEKLPSQKVKLKSGKKKPMNEAGKKKKVKKLFKRKRDESMALLSEDSNMSSSSQPPQSLSSTSRASALAPGTSQSQDGFFSQLNHPSMGPPSSHISHNLSASIETDGIDSPLDNNFSTVIPRTNVTSIGSEQKSFSTENIVSSLQSSQKVLESPSTQKSSTLVVEPEPSKKKARLSMEDDFSIFEDENLGENDDVIGDVEHIDDLLQDIDDLLS